VQLQHNRAGRYRRVLERSSKGLQGLEVLQQLCREAAAAVAVFPLTSVLFEVMGLSGLFPKNFSGA